MDIQKKQKKYEFWGKVGLLALAAFVVSPVVFLVVKGILGIALAALAGATLVALAPVFSMKLANARLKMIKREASVNPIETMQGVLLQRLQEKKAFGGKISALRASIEGFANKAETIKLKWPKDADKFDQQLVNLRQILSDRQRKYENMGLAIDNYQLEIERATAIWETNQALAAAGGAAGQAQEEFWADIKYKTAIDSVEQSLNRAFADMEVEMLDARIQPLMIGGVSHEVLPLQQLPVAEKVK